MIFTVENPIQAAAGDIVTISSNSKTVLWSAVVLYMMPLLLFFVGYFAGVQLSVAAGLMGCVGFIFGIILAIIYDRKVLAKKKESYIITGFGQNIELEG